MTPAWPFCCQSVGLAARFLEETGFSTVILTPTYDFHRTVGIPRSAAIEYPLRKACGTGGRPGRHRKVSAETLEVSRKGQKTREVWHLPFTWPEEPKKTDWQPPEIFLIAKILFGGYQEGKGNVKLKNLIKENRPNISLWVPDSKVCEKRRPRGASNWTVWSWCGSEGEKPITQTMFGKEINREGMCEKS